MTFHIVCQDQLWRVVDEHDEIGGLFIDLASAIRFIRQQASAARIVVRSLPA